MYCGHGLGYSSKTITLLIRLGFSFPAAPNNINLVQAEHSQISGVIGVVCEKVAVRGAKRAKRESKNTINCLYKVIYEVLIGRCQNVWSWMISKRESRYFFSVGDLFEITLARKRGHFTAILKVSNETCALVINWSKPTESRAVSWKPTAVSRGFHATARLSCLTSVDGKLHLISFPSIMSMRQWPSVSRRCKEMRHGS